MGKGRDIIFYALAYILGDVLWQVLLSLWGLPPVIILAVLLAAEAGFCISVLCRKGNGTVDTFLLLACFAFLGMSGAIVGGISREGMFIFEKAGELKDVISGILDGLLPEGNPDETAVAKALAIGDKSMIDSALKNQYKASGAMHLLALSGLHVGVIYAFLNAAMSFLGNSPAARTVRRISVLAALWSFALISGLSSSICRAVTMITVYETGSFLGAGRNMLRALATSALLICLFNPDAPFGIGFQLSYSAVLGIYFLYPRLKALLDARSLPLKYIWNTVSLSICCQAATAPLSFLYFGSFPKYFMVTNLLAIPLSSAAMWLLPITVAARNIPFIGVPGGRILLETLRTLNEVISIISSL
ncbi:MAG: ComEC/Rec2 family competence protein [Bacteroidales bacterium]|nr:ComEC/Rec2 family competence protein [Bacteroidales bacterium]